MEEETNKITTATNKITTFRKFKELIKDMLNGYPLWEYYGKFESIFKEHGKKAVEILSRHKVIEKIPINEVKKTIKATPTEELNKLPQGKNKFVWYRLAPRGVDLAISMVNLKYAERMTKYSKKVLGYTKVIKTLTWVMVGVTILNLIMFSISFIL